MAARDGMPEIGVFDFTSDRAFLVTGASPMRGALELSSSPVELFPALRGCFEGGRVEPARGAVTGCGALPNFNCCFTCCCCGAAAAGLLLLLFALLPNVGILRCKAALVFGAAFLAVFRRWRRRGRPSVGMIPRLLSPISLAFLALCCC